jgi:WD40-like Beta Propeller Repeat
VPDETLKDLKNYDIKKSTAGRAPLPLPGISAREDELHPWITRDGREFYFSRKTKEGWKLFVAAGPVPGPIGNANEVGFPPGYCHATVSASGLIMYLQGPLENDRAGLFRSKRMNLKGKWSTPESLTMLNHPEAKRGDMSPSLSNDGKKLYFASDRPGGKGGLDIWVADTSQLFKNSK